MQIDNFVKYNSKADRDLKKTIFFRRTDRWLKKAITQQLSQFLSLKWTNQNVSSLENQSVKTIKLLWSNNC